MLGFSIASLTGEENCTATQPHQGAPRAGKLGLPPTPEDLPATTAVSSLVQGADKDLSQNAMLGMDRQLSSGSDSGGSVGSGKSAEGLSAANSSSGGESKSAGGPGAGRAGKPSQAYIELISKAILASPERKLLLKDIYQYIKDNYPYYNNDAKAWRNSVRHNLSLNECFIKMGRAENGKGNFWAIHPANLEDFANGDFRRRQARRRARKSSARETNISSLPRDYRLNLGYVPMTASPQPFHSYGSMPFCSNSYSAYSASAPFLDYSQVSPPSSTPQAITSSGYAASQAASRLSSVQGFGGNGMMTSAFNSVTGLQEMEAIAGVASSQRSSAEALSGGQGYDLGARMGEGGDVSSLRLPANLQNWSDCQDYRMVGRLNAASQRLASYCMGQEQGRPTNGDPSPQIYAQPQPRADSLHWPQDCYQGEADITRALPTP